jgi:hypothetical protein
MPVRIDKAGHHDLPLRIDHHSAGRRQIRPDRYDRTVAHMHRPVSDIVELRIHGDDDGIGDDEFATCRQRHTRPFEASVAGALSKGLRHEAGGADGGQAAQKTTPAKFTHGSP